MKKILLILVSLLLVMSIVSCNPWHTEHKHKINGDIMLTIPEELPDEDTLPYDTTYDTSEDTTLTKGW